MDASEIATHYNMLEHMPFLLWRNSDSEGHAFESHRAYLQKALISHGDSRLVFLLVWINLITWRLFWVLLPFTRTKQCKQ